MHLVLLLWYFKRSEDNSSIAFYEESFDSCIAAPALIQAWHIESYRTSAASREVLVRTLKRRNTKNDYFTCLMYFTTLGQFIFPLNWLKIHIDDIVFRTSRTRPGLLGRRGHVLCGDPGVCQRKRLSIFKWCQRLVGQREEPEAVPCETDHLWYVHDFMLT